MDRERRSRLFPVLLLPLLAIAFLLLVVQSAPRLSFPR